ncbi:MAG: hypothetical protein AMXMBFR80_11830 [Dehalococcoidia bacterium]|jgi:hypothetical protein|nr:hypothetical protein [Tepidiformaceae bacterium]
MSDRYDSYPDDEPVIGATYPPPPPPPAGDVYIGAATVGAYPAEEDSDAEDDYDEGYDDDYDEYGEPYYGEYDDVPPARQPLFYVFVALAALVGGIVVFLLFSVVNGGGDDGGTGGSARFDVQVDSPPGDKRIYIGEPEDVVVQATASEPIVRFELFVGDRPVDSVDVTETPDDNRYVATLRLLFEQTGTYEFFVRVTSSSGATKDSPKVRVYGVESVGERPQSIKGRAVADTTLRAGPGEDFAEAGTLKAGEEVTIVGKSRSLEWLLVEAGGQEPRWARRSAIDPLDTLDLVQTRDVTPTPAPTATETPEPTPEPSPSVSPSPGPNAPDFVPTNAVLVDGGSLLRVTVSNVSNNAYNGPVVVAVGGGDVPQQELVIDASMDANGGAASLEFEVNPPITTQGKRAVVTVDPMDAVRELREDNNVATFVLLPPQESPEIVIESATVTGNQISVTIRNNGGALSATAITVRVSQGSQTISNAATLALAKDQSSTIQVTSPGASGTALVEVLAGGQVQDSREIQLGP